MQQISRALISVSDKTGIVEFARELHLMNIIIYSTGGTSKTLRDAGIPTIDVSELTGSPEMMDGRVKTLHPRVHGGLLARLDNPDHVSAMQEHGIVSIDLLVLNLYPFEQTIKNPTATHDEIIEQIDIGGPAMLRSAAKNYLFTGVVTNSSQYERVLNELKQENLTLSDSTLIALASDAFSHVARYDALIADYFAKQTRKSDQLQDTLSVELPRVQHLRYGENPHQQAGLYGTFSSIFSQLHGKELSYNNILDIDAASKLALEFDPENPTVVIVKHTNPCGVGCGENLSDAWTKAFACDTTSAFGGIVAVNSLMDAETASAINEIFTEVIIAPGYTEEALVLLRKKKDRRLITADYQRLRHSFGVELRSVAGGVLAQTSDTILMHDQELRVVTKLQPTEDQTKALMFAWKIAKHVKSNAIVYTTHDRTLGIGAGQMSRVDSAMIAVHKANRAGLNLDGCAVASDAFFPFADGLLEAVKAGATSVIQPGGSVRDQEVIDAADDNGIAMIMTGMRHFRH